MLQESLNRSLVRTTVVKLPQPGIDHAHGRHDVAHGRDVFYVSRQPLPVLPFATDQWLFRERAVPLTVVLPDGTAVDSQVVQLYAKKTLPYLQYMESPSDRQPWCVAPTVALLKSTLKPV